jgi:nucleoside 2-deoxyribosyltransferase
MKIYFAGSIKGGRNNQDSYEMIVHELKKYGKVLTEHVADKSLTDKGEMGVTDKYIFQRDTKWLRECDVLIAEITTPSLGVGYEIGYVETLKKPILCLYRKIDGKSPSAMISGNPSVKISSYNELAEIQKILSKYFISFVSN